MNYSVSSKIFFTLFLFLIGIFLFAQDSESGDNMDIFDRQEILEVKMQYSIKQLRKISQDSLTTIIQLGYVDEDGKEKSLEISFETRGNFRLNNCYFPPLKVRIKKRERKGTIFANHKEMKLVMPCRKEPHGNDYVLKEYLAYKLFEEIAPIYFKTRLLKIHFKEIQKKKNIEYELYGFLIEDIKKVAERNDGKEIKNFIPEQNHEPVSSARNAMFQYMIGNVDYSTGRQHNAKLIYLGAGVTSVLYDFDMSGFVDPSYGQLPLINGEVIDLNDIKERLYRGYLQDELIMQSVRTEFINKKSIFFQIIDDHNTYFTYEKEKMKAKNYLESFYKEIEDDRSFKNKILKIALHK